jgi:hypothetical protein
VTHRLTRETAVLQMRLSLQQAGERIADGNGCQTKGKWEDT